MPPTIDPSVRSDFRRCVKRLQSPNGVMTPADHIDVMRRLMHTIDRDARIGVMPETRQLVNLAAHAIVVATEAQA
jgi:hypothetical protein